MFIFQTEGRVCDQKVMFCTLAKKQWYGHSSGMVIVIYLFDYFVATFIAKTILKLNFRKYPAIHTHYS